MTIRERIQEFPEPYRSKMLANTEQRILDHDDGANSDRHIIRSSFIWSESQEGQGYWWEFYLTRPADQ
jgi:hypothetical protein